METFQITEHYDDMSNEKYHSFGTEIISSSYIKNVAKHSISKAKAPFTGNAEALYFGTMFHDVMELGVEGFNKKYTIEPKPPQEILDKYKNYKLSTEYKNWKKENLDDVGDIVTQSDYDRLMIMRKNTYNNEIFQHWQDNYEYFDEHSFFGEYNGLRFRVRPDRYYTDNNQRNIIVDFKTCQDITRFKWDIKSYRYDIQAVFYADFLGVDPSNFFFIAVEKEGSLKSQVFGLKPEQIEYARRDLYSTIDKIKRNDHSVLNYGLIERV